MYEIPVVFGPILDPVILGLAPVADLSVGLAAWLGAAAVVYLTLLPLALRRRGPDRAEIAREAVALREAA